MVKFLSYIESISFQSIRNLICRYPHNFYRIACAFESLVCSFCCVFSVSSANNLSYPFCDSASNRINGAYNAIVNICYYSYSCFCAFFDCLVFRILLKLLAFFRFLESFPNIWGYTFTKSEQISDLSWGEL